MGRRDINRILAEANRTGYYIRPRVDIELLLSLKPENVIITTACVAFHKYDDVEQIILQLYEHFGNHFYLEVQYHNTDSQRGLNQKLKMMHYKYKIPLIFGCDSHFINENSAQERTDFLLSKNISYPEEEGWYLDYPDGDTVYQRFVTQGILSHDEIMEAINNTNVFLQAEEYNSPIFDKTVKLPTLYPEWTQEQKDREYERLVWDAWEEYKKEIPEESHAVYEREIKAEVDIVINCHMVDYFILNYYIIKRGKELGGVITSTGRGSAVSFITNKLLGFTEVDRIAAQVEMYPERFMSATRILETGSLPDYKYIRHQKGPNKYYVYQWYLVDTGEVFYVGKGSSKRFANKSCRTNHFQEIIRKYDCASRILISGLSEENAYEMERFIIDYYIKHTSYYQKRERINDVYKTKEFRAKISKLVQGKDNPNYGNHWSQEQKEAMGKKQVDSGRYKDTKNPTATKYNV